MKRCHAWVLQPMRLFTPSTVAMRFLALQGFMVVTLSGVCKCSSTLCRSLLSTHWVFMFLSIAGTILHKQAGGNSWED